MKNMIIVLLAFCLMPNNISNAQAGYASDLTREELTESVNRIVKDKIPGEFTRVSGNILKFEGKIVEGTYEEYLKHIDDGIDTLIINSTGGCTNNGVKMGLDLYGRGLTIIVEGAAASSAANYLFLAGKKRVIEKGFVAFHGNAKALFDSKGWENIKSEICRALPPDGDLEFFVESFRQGLEETIRLEKEFFEKINVPQSFFDLTQLKSKGLQPDLDYFFDFLIPSQETLEKFGISGVAGNSDVALAEELGMRVIYY